MSEINDLSLDNFKKWMKHQDKEQHCPTVRAKTLIGLNVESKLPIKRLLAKLEAENGKPTSLAREFGVQGGTIIGVDGKRFLIEVNEGSFYIHRCYVRKR